MDSPTLDSAVLAALKAAEGVQQDLNILIYDDEEMHPDGRKRPRPGQVPRPDYKNSTWGKMLREESNELRIPGSTAANLFRRRFRLPYPLFEMLMIDIHLWQDSSRF